MKRSVPDTEYSILLPHQILLPELFPHILGYLSSWQRYRMVTVCKAWSEPRGYLDQSTETLSKRDPIPIDLSRLVNLKKISAIGSNPLLAGVRDGLFKKLSSLRIGLDFRQPLDTYMVSAMRSLANLTSLTLSGTLSSFTATFKHLSLLEKLDIRCNHTGESNDFDEALSLLPSLTSLRLRAPDMTGSCFRSLTKLRELELYARLRLDVTLIGKLTQLTRLFITMEFTGSKLKQLVDDRCHLFRDLTNLTALGLPCNGIVRNQHISHLSSLRLLDLNDNTVISSAVLLHFPHLTTLVLCDRGNGNHCNGLRDERLNFHISTLTELKSLSYECHHGPSLNDFMLRQFTSLTSLHIYGNRNITSVSLSFLTNLRELEISETPLNNIDFSVLPVSITNLDLRHSINWHQSIRPLSSRLTNLRHLALGLLKPKEPLDDWCESLTSLHSLERVTHTNKFSRGHNNPHLKLVGVPDHIEVRRY